MACIACRGCTCFRGCTPCGGVDSENGSTFTSFSCSKLMVRVDSQGQEVEGAGEGFLCMKAAWPSTIRTIFGDQDRFETTYFAPFKVCPPKPLTFPWLCVMCLGDTDGVGSCPVPGRGGGWGEGYSWLDNMSRRSGVDQAGVACTEAVGQSNQGT